MNGFLIFLIVLGGLIGAGGLAWLSAYLGKRALQKRNARIGEAGENAVSSILNRHAKSTDRLIDDIILYNERCGSSQIDHIFLCEQGIFVIETKNRAGEIYGSDDMEEWRQVLADGELVHTFHSPIRQNQTHVHLIGQILHHKYKVYGYVVFVRENVEHIKSERVVTPSGLLDVIRAKRGISLTPTQIEEIYDTIHAYRRERPVSKAEHYENIQKVKESKGQ